MRKIILGTAAVALYGAMRLVAQQPAPAPHLDALLHGHVHARPASVSAPRTPDAVFDATRIGSPVLLDKGWRVGITSNPDAALPEFDDSAWPVRNATASFAEVPDEDDTGGNPNWKSDEDHLDNHQRPYVWFRLHLKLAPGHGPVALLVDLPVTQNTNLSFVTPPMGVDVFANGKPILPEGVHAATAEEYQPISRIYNLNLAPSETSLTLAVRTIYIPFGSGAYTNFFAAHTLRLGYREDLDGALQIWSNRTLFERLPRLVTAFLLLSLAIFLFALYFSQKGHPEYLWLALHELLQVPIAFVELAGSSARLDLLWYAALSLQLMLISAYLYFEFLIAFLALRRRWYIRVLRFAAPVMAAVGPALLVAGHSTSMGIPVIVLIVAIMGSLLWVVGWLIFVLSTLIAASARRNFEAGLLLIPLLLTLVGWIEPVVTGALSDFGGHAVYSPLTFQAGPIPIHFASIADFTGILAIVLIIFVRFLRVQREQERASSELAAARSVQELMIPQEKQATPGFEVNSVYTPANEVGGDFFHVQPIAGGGLLVVIGDVAGKGLKAAMNVSMLMGALRQSVEHSPARILESLNRVLVGTDSFTTCQAAWFGADGGLVLASAGHLPPYLNSREVPLPGGLPLGVISGVSYEEVRLFLHPGDRLLLLSDGVVEARRPSGELFGFSRLHNLSNQSAFYIADAATEFGQEDDITVLTVRRLEQGLAAGV